MFRGFNLIDIDESFGDEPYNFNLDYVLHKETAYNQEKWYIKETLSKYTLEDNIINATAMQDDWFPDIDADIFISHSHNDLNTALYLKYWLKNNFDLEAFIDSCIWGNIEDLQRLIDDEIAWQENSQTYNYNLRNFTTSHVHMMLNMALMKMMHKCECLFFLNTPESVPINDVYDGTFSPWIFSEIGMSKLIEKTAPTRKLQKSTENIVSFSQKQLMHKIDLSHLKKLTILDFMTWKFKVRSELHNGKHPLDILYKMKP